MTDETGGNEEEQVISNVDRRGTYHIQKDSYNTKLGGLGFIALSFEGNT